MLHNPGLVNPSLKALSYLLRHKEFWPADFEWNYAHPCSCAMGLSRTFWPGLQQGYLNDGLGTTGDMVAHLFAFGSYPVPDREVTPEMVADRIDGLEVVA